MNNRQMKEYITKQLEQIKHTIDRHKDISNMTVIDRDLLLEKLRKIYDLLLNIEIIEHKPISFEKKVKAGEVKEQNIKESQVENSSVIESNVIIEFEQDENSNNSIKVESAKNAEDEKTIETTSKEKKTIAEIYSKNDPLINEYLAAKMKQKDLSTLLQNRPIKNLTEAIDINDKFYFTRELFHNDHQLFHKTIEVLNNLPTFNDAIKYLNQQFIWNFESETVQRFLEVLRRRYISDKE